MFSRISNHTAKNAKIKHPQKCLPVRYTHVNTCCMPLHVANQTQGLAILATATLRAMHLSLVEPDPLIILPVLIMLTCQYTTACNHYLNFLFLPSVSNLNYTVMQSLKDFLHRQSLYLPVAIHSHGLCLLFPMESLFTTHCIWAVSLSIMGLLLLLIYLEVSREGGSEGGSEGVSEGVSERVRGEGGREEEREGVSE